MPSPTGKFAIARVVGSEIGKTPVVKAMFRAKVIWGAIRNRIETLISTELQNGLEFD